VAFSGKIYRRGNYVGAHCHNCFWMTASTGPKAELRVLPLVLGHVCLPSVPVTFNCVPEEKV